MSIHAKTVAVAISASTASATGTIPVSDSPYIRVVNGTTALCYVATGTAPTATAANIAVAPYGELIVRRALTDTTAAVLLSAGTGVVSVSPYGQ